MMALNPKSNSILKFEARRVFGAALFLVFLSSCKPTDFETVRKADHEALSQRAQLAKYLYLQVIKTRNSRDDVRLRALEGLVEVTSTQTFEYSEAVKGIELAVHEFGQDPQYEHRITQLRQRGAEIYRNNLQDFAKALALMEPISKRSDATADVLQMSGRIRLSLRMFEDAEKDFLRAWDISLKTKSCPMLKSLQMDLIQRNVLEKKCEAAAKWMDVSPLSGCESDHFGIEAERANCLEIGNEPTKALKIIEDIIAKDPTNSRAHFLLDGLKRRMREKSLN